MDNQQNKIHLDFLKFDEPTRTVKRENTSIINQFHNRKMSHETDRGA
jgi:hypothetical protein